MATMIETVKSQFPLLDIGNDIKIIFHMSNDKKGDQPRPFQGEFSFVNKDAGNIDSKDHNAAVSWHVLNRYEKWKKKEQAKKLRASASIPTNSGSNSAQSLDQSNILQLSTSTPFDSREGSSSESSKRRRLSERSRLQSGPSIPLAPIGLDPWMANQSMQLGYGNSNRSTDTSSGIPTSAASSPTTTYFGPVDEDLLASIFTLPNDTYDVGPLEVDFGLQTPLTDNLLTFARDFVIPQTWPNEMGKILGKPEIDRALDDISTIYEETSHANAYFTYLSAFLADIRDDKELAAQTQLFRSRAMTELSRQVSQPGQKSLNTLKAILKLFASESIVDNTSVARSHLKMLRNVINAQGGILALDAWFREDLLSSDVYFALKYETRPLFPAQEWTPGPLGQPWKVRLAAAGSHETHTNVHHSVEHAVLKSIILDVRELIKTHTYILNHDLPTDDQLLRWHQLRRLDCVSRIADHYLNMIIYSHLYNAPQTQAFISIAIALFLHLLLGSPEPVRFGLTLIENLRKKLSESEDEDEEETGKYKRVRFWAVYVGMLAEKVHPVPAASAGWFECCYRSIAPVVEAYSTDESQEILKSFLFSESLEQEINNDHPFRMSDFRKGLYSISGTSWRKPIANVIEEV